MPSGSSQRSAMVMTHYPVEKNRINKRLNPDCAGFNPMRLAFAFAALHRRAAQIAEEVTGGIKHQHILLAIEAVTVSIEATPESEELQVLAVSLGEDRRRFGIPLTAQGFGTLGGLGQQDVATPIGVGTDTLGLLLTLGTPFARFPLTLGAHPLEDRRRDVLR